MGGLSKKPDRLVNRRLADPKVALPDVSVIRAALERLVVVSQPEMRRDADDVVVAPTLPRLLPDGSTTVDSSEIIMRMGSSGELPVHRLVERVAEALEKMGHPHVHKKGPFRARIASHLIAIAVLRRDSDQSILDSLYDVLQTLSPARAYLFSILIAPSTNASIHRIGDFAYGPVDMGALKAACERAGSDYYELYVSKIRGRRCVSRDYRDLLLVDAESLPPRRLGADEARWLYRLVDEYYVDLAEAEKRSFTSDLDRQQAIFGAAGLGTISSDFLQSMEALTTWVAVFTREARRHGWVVPLQSSHTISTTEPNALSNVMQEIRRALKLDDWGSRCLDREVQRFCDYVTTASAYESQGKCEEALLHLMFGLDLLLGGEANEPLTTILSERVAIVSHVALGERLDNVIEFIRESYEMRSGYAHRGQRGEMDSLDRTMRLEDRVTRLVRIARAVLGAACFARFQEWSQDSSARSNWVKRIDVLRAKRAAGLPFSNDDLHDLGLPFVRVESTEVAEVVLDLA